ncbi:hypothetical protein BIV57_10420 [Mangrovactinospora gilvigrisea]|uniref:RDD domain-containing protein n=1 Tax=Mangrovactinospora gilvigrisea TaxID=1428644 RepID=A0A1J7BFS2_9ACTN|nr:RDD family protein [Mangrovactinospora gilvigrisea]OIV37531.1 hypothetical protein BIV57_10420 [Mangrovactinospora gilvigrisea]
MDDTRKALGSWISGPQAAAEDAGADFGYRGKRLGLPEDGPGSIAPTGRRLGAVFIDWVLCQLIATQLIARGDTGLASICTSGLFLLMSVVLVGTTGTTPGKRIFGLRVIGLGGARATVVQALIRTFLLLLVIPAVVWDRDTRGLHDKAARTVEVRA